MSSTSTNTSRGSIIAITSGKGGVGKTNVVINLATSLARLGHRVGVIDADFGLGNIDVLLGLTPEYHIGHLLSGEKTLEEITLRGPSGITIIPAGSGIRSLTQLGRQQWQAFEAVVKKISAGLDYLLIDTAAGVELLTMAERVLVVTSYEPAAVVDAYAVIKILNGAAPAKEVGLIVNSARDGEEASSVFRQLDVASNRFLKRALRFYGYVVQDAAVRDAVLVQRPVVDQLPQAPASRCFRILASRLSGIGPGAGTNPGGGAVVRIPARPLSRPASREAFPAEETTRCA
jgi:flagellar biosynthesis protein FlhG